MKKVLTIIVAIILVGGIGIIIYNVNFKDKDFYSVTEINNDAITSIEVNKLSGDSDQQQVVNITNRKEIRKVMSDFADAKWVREPQSLNPDEYYSVILKNEKIPKAVLFVNSNDSFYVTTSKDEGSNANSFILKEDKIIEIQKLFK
ncbi:hypothetical protein [Niallia taxi]|uniref:Uncharacterized protein n=1 Tax=Niallia taxi TaxID=2499688 RepID=A0A3S2TVW7_9BACI|nr:hypothetical protein [Niallia taxi]MED4039733.1 hypothetical protein [Niallia taxi]RVT59958.1 hypothetical protein EM808_18745 [Niallia taxi]